MLRFIASTLVILYHIGVMWDGYKGVNIFFVISGFVIYLSSTNKIGQGISATRRFLYRRNVRIYTFYWILFFVLIALGHIPFTLDFSFLKKVLLAPGHVLPQLGITWSLTYELYFYYLFALAILLPIRRIYFIRLVLVLWLCSGVIVFLLNTPYYIKGTALNFFLGQNIWQFLTGILAAHVYMHRSHIHPNIFKLALVLGIFMVFFLYFPNRHPLSHPVYGIGSALLVVGIAALETGKKLRACWGFVFGVNAAKFCSERGATIEHGRSYVNEAQRSAGENFASAAQRINPQHALKFPDIISTLGDASYVAYLIHVPILTLLDHYNIVSKAQFNESILYVIPVLIGIWICSLILYQWIEKPLLKYLYK